MTPFATGHASHPQWPHALAMAVAQARGELGSRTPTLCWLYFTDHYAAQADELASAVQRQWPQAAVVGCVGVGVAAGGVEYFDEPALVLMLADLPREQFRVFSGVTPLAGFAAFTAQVHADGATAELGELIDELAQRTDSGYLFGGLASSRARTVTVADGVYSGGLSGVAFARDVALVSRVTQGCQPIGAARSITRCERNLVLALDGQPALDALLADLKIGEDQPRALLPRLRATLVGLTDAQDELGARSGQFGADTRVRHLVGIDPGSRAIAVADTVQADMRLAFCQRDVNAARRDLVRICSEIREELEAHAPALAIGPAAPVPGAASRIRGAIYVSCAGRGGPHFGAPSAELAIVKQALGDVPLAGFFAGGEIARHHVYGYTGVLTVFAG